MNTRLRPCTVCLRHVRASESSCPFCAAVLAPLEEPTRLPDTRGLSRRARVALGAALAGAAVAACGGDGASQNPPVAPTATSEPASPPDDDGAPVAEYGAPAPPDDSVAPPDDDGAAAAEYGVAPPDDDGAPVTKYGAPPAPPDNGAMKPMYGLPPSPGPQK